MVLRLAAAETKVIATVDAAATAATPTSAIYFTKLRPCILASGPAALRDVAISSVPASPLDSLYSALHGVYAPALLGGSALTSSDDKLRGLLGDLDKALAAAVRKAASDSSGAGGSASTGLAGIVGVRDEQRYWEDQARGGAARERERAQAFARQLEPVAVAFDSAESAQTSQLAELAEDVQVRHVSGGSVPPTLGMGGHC